MAHCKQSLYSAPPYQQPMQVCLGQSFEFI